MTATTHQSQQVDASTFEEARDLLRQTMEHAGVSRYALAQTAGITRQQVGGFLNGTHGISLPMLARMFEALGYRLVLNLEPT